MNLSIKIDGLSELLAKFQKMPDEMKDGLKKGLLQGGELIRAEAAATAPVDTGRLRGSIVVEDMGGNRVRVGTNTEYAIYVEFGTGAKGDSAVAHTTKTGWVYYNEKTGGFVYTTGQPPQPFLVPALYAQQDAVIEAIKRNLLVAL